MKRLSFSLSPKFGLTLLVILASELLFINNLQAQQYQQYYFDIIGPTAICPGSSYMYTTSGYTGPGTVFWSVTGGNFVGPSSGSSVTVTWNSDYGTLSASSYYFDCNDDCPPFEPCEIQPMSFTCYDYYYDSYPFSVSSFIAMAWASGATTICQGSQLQLNTYPGFTYQWKKDGANIVGATNQFYYANTAGSYTVALTANGCTRVSDPIVVTVNPMPSQPTISSAFTQLVPGSTQLSASNGLNFQWYKDGNILPGKTQNELVVTVPGSYAVSNSVNGCSSSSSAVSVSGGNNNNFVVSNAITIPGITTESQLLSQTLSSGAVLQSVTYLDGQGKSLQSIQTQASPDHKDLIQPAFYDNLGRQSKSHLPMQANQNNGLLMPNILSGSSGEDNYVGSPHYQFYNSGSSMLANDAKPFAKAEFELSPLSRTKKQGSVGTSWQPGGADAEFIYGSNLTNDIRIWTISTSTVPSGLPQSSATWPASSLSVTKTYSTVTTSPLKKIESEVVTNREGLKLVERIKYDGTNWAETYYVYDNRNNLRFILPPQLVKELRDASNFNSSQEQVAAWAYQFVYDNLNRVIESKAPGIDWEYTVYDERDRVVLIQDGNQRQNNEWSYVKYDELNRPVITGIYKPGSAITRESMQTTVNGLNGGAGYQNLPAPGTIVSGVEIGVDIVVNAYENVNEYKAVNSIVIKPGFTFTAGSTGSSFRASIDNGSGVVADVFPVTNDEALTIAFYDSYDNCVICQEDSYQFAGQTWTSTPVSGVFDKFTRLKDLPVATSVKVLDSDQWLHSVTYYNKYYQPIQSVSLIHRGSIRRSSSLYDFSGKMIESKVSLDGNTVTRRYQYDHAGRLLKLYHRINSQPEVILDADEYNDLGQRITKKMHSDNNGSSYLQVLDYRYNIKGWLTNLNYPLSSDDYFGMQLGYNEALPAGNNTRLDGLITGSVWKNNLAADKEHAYNYSYTDMGYLQNASYKNKAGTWNNSGYATEGNLSYDLNGNIKTLQRYEREGLTAQVVDELAYDYGTGGNQLMRVSDNAPTANKDRGFKDGTNSGNDYLYDLNGNLISDQNKNIIIESH
jgi:hypothetical protein